MVPGVNLTLYLKFARELYGAQTGIAAKRISSSVGMPVSWSTTVKFSYSATHDDPRRPYINIHMQYNDATYRLALRHHDDILFLE